MASNNTQTLEQILQEQDDDQFLTSLGIVSKNDKAKETDFTVEENKTLLTDSQRSKIKLEKKRKILHTVLLPKPLIRISQILASPKVRSEGGYPTCLCVGKWIAIGTAHGVILLFDHNQQLKQMVGSTAQIENCNSVTAIDIAKDQEWLIAGYQKFSLDFI